MVDYDDQGPVHEDAGEELGGVWKTIKGIFSKPITININLSQGKYIEKARALWGKVKDLLTKTITTRIAFAAGIIEKAKQLWENIKDIFSRAQEIKVKFASAIIARAKDLWENIKAFSTTSTST